GVLAALRAVFLIEEAEQNPAPLSGFLSDPVLDRVNDGIAVAGDTERVPPSIELVEVFGVSHVGLRATRDFASATTIAMLPHREKTQRKHPGAFPPPPPPRRTSSPVISPIPRIPASARSRSISSRISPMARRTPSSPATAAA